MPGYANTRNLLIFSLLVLAPGLSSANAAYDQFQQQNEARRQQQVDEQRQRDEQQRQQFADDFRLQQQKTAEQNRQTQDTLDRLQKEAVERQRQERDHAREKNKANHATGNISRPAPAP